MKAKSAYRLRNQPQKVSFLTVAILLFHTLLVGQVIPLPELGSGTIERLGILPTEQLTPRMVDVWLPDGYPGNGPYAVLYMHDGQMLFDSSLTWNNQEWGIDETMGKLLNDGSIRPTIVVAVWNGGPERHTDYYPQKPFESLPADVRDSMVEAGRKIAYKSMFVGDMHADGYLTYLTQELKPLIDSLYFTRADRDNTMVAGSSMGGLISWYALCEYPEVFGGAACLSTHWPGQHSFEGNPAPQAFFDYLDSHLPDPATHKIYMDHGTATLDALYAPYQQQADSIIRAHGYNDEHFMTRVYEGDAHDEHAWQRRMNVPLIFLLNQD